MDDSKFGYQHVPVQYGKGGSDQYVPGQWSMHLYFDILRYIKIFYRRINMAWY